MALMINMPGKPRDVANDLRQFDVHLLHGLLHVLDVMHWDLHLTQSPVGTHREHEIGRPERRAKRP